MKGREFWLLACALTLLGLAVQAVAAPRPPAGTASENAALIWGTNPGADFLYGGPLGYNTAPKVAPPVNKVMDTNPLAASVKPVATDSRGIAEVLFGISVDNNVAPEVSRPAYSAATYNPLIPAQVSSAGQFEDVAETVFGMNLENNTAPEVHVPTYDYPITTQSPG